MTVAAIKIDLPQLIAAITALLTALGVVLAQLVKLRGSVAAVHQEVAETKAAVNGGLTAAPPPPPAP